MGKGKNARRLKIKKNMLIEKSADFDCGKIVARLDDMAAAIMMLTESIEKLTSSQKSIPIEDATKPPHSSVKLDNFEVIPFKGVGKIQPFDITKEEFDDTPPEIQEFLKQVEDEKKHLIEVTPHKVQDSDVVTVGGFEFYEIRQAAIDNHLDMAHVETIVSGKSEEFLKNRKISNEVKAMHIATTIALFSALGISKAKGSKLFGFKSKSTIHNWQYRLKRYMPN